MVNAIENAKVDSNSITYVNTHATSTPSGDIAEINAIKRLFATKAGKLYISSYKGALGHLLGAAGAAELTLAIMSCKNKIIAPTLNLQDIDPALEIDKTPNLTLVAQKSLNIDNMKNLIFLKNSFGFGGTNASICFGTYQNQKE